MSEISGVLRKENNLHWIHQEEDYIYIYTENTPKEINTEKTQAIQKTQDSHDEQSTYPG